MSKLVRYITLLAAGLSLGLGAGCGKSKAQKQVDAALQTPEAAAVMTALQKQDYDGAVSAWMNVRASATNDAQQAQAAILTQQLKLKLYDPATTNAQAANALQTIRMMTAGR